MSTRGTICIIIQACRLTTIEHHIMVFETRQLISWHIEVEGNERVDRLVNIATKTQSRAAAAAYRHVVDLP